MLPSLHLAPSTLSLTVMLSTQDLGELKALRNPPAGVDDITAVCLCLLENVPKNRSWAAAAKLMGNVDAFLARLKVGGSSKAALP